MAYDRGMHTPGPRWCGLVVGLALAACSHPGPTPRAPEPDDERAGAIELVWSARDERFRSDGVIDASTGDVSDWYAVPLPADGPRRFDLTVDSTERDGHLPVDVFVYDATGAQTDQFAAKPFAGAVTVWATGILGEDRAFVEVRARPASRRTTYRLEVRSLVTPPAPEPRDCDPDHWDASNPRCEHVCDRKKPDLRSVACCDLMRPCSKGVAVMPCRGAVTGFADGMFWVSVGRADAGIEFLPAYLPVPSGEPPVYTPAGQVIAVRDHRHLLELVSAQDHTSVWRLRDPHGHDAAWIAANALRFEIPPLPVCR